MSIIKVQSQLNLDYAVPLPRPLQLGANTLIIGLWLWLYRPVFDYLAIIFTREDFRTTRLK